MRLSTLEWQLSDSGRVGSPGKSSTWPLSSALCWYSTGHVVWLAIIQKLPYGSGDRSLVRSLATCGGESRLPVQTASLGEPKQFPSALPWAEPRGECRSCSWLVNREQSNSFFGDSLQHRYISSTCPSAHCFCNSSYPLLLVFVLTFGFINNNFHLVVKSHAVVINLRISYFLNALRQVSDLQINLSALS